MEMEMEMDDFQQLLDQIDDHDDQDDQDAFEALYEATR